MIRPVCWKLPGFFVVWSVWLFSMGMTSKDPIWMVWYWIYETIFLISISLSSVWSGITVLLNFEKSVVAELSPLFMISEGVRTNLMIQSIECLCSTFANAGPVESLSILWQFMHLRTKIFLPSFMGSAFIWCHEVNIENTTGARVQNFIFQFLMPGNI